MLVKLLVGEIVAVPCGNCGHCLNSFPLLTFRFPLDTVHCRLPAELNTIFKKREFFLLKIDKK
jgi:hypothetical protein